MVRAEVTEHVEARCARRCVMCHRIDVTPRLDRRLRMTRRMTTRQLIVLLSLAGACAQPDPPPERTAERTDQMTAYTPNPVEVENTLAGSADWRITGTMGSDATGQMQGYASDVSVNLGGTIDLHVTVSPAQTYTIDIYRMGWYSGAGGRLMQAIGPLNGTTQPICQTMSGGPYRSVACQWAIAHTLTIPATWTSGIYLAKLTNAAGFQSYIMFVVRDDQRTSDLVYQQAVLTYQAYNNYPASSPAKLSFYSAPPGTPFVGRRLSFDRPYSSTQFPRNNNGDGAGGFFTWDHPMIRWLEMNGYDVTYAANTDLHRGTTSLSNAKGVLSLGHDEYWSQTMYSVATAARNDGVGWAFLTGNMVFRQVALEPWASVANRVMRSVTAAGGPTLVNDPDHEKRQALTGLAVTGCCVRDPTLYYNLDFVVTEPDHDIFADADFQPGSIVAGILGYEPDAVRPAYALPPHRTFDILSRSPFVSAGPVTVNPWPLSEANTVIYQAPSRAWVFTAGMTDWAWGLDNEHQGGGPVADARIQITTENALARLVAGPTPQGPYCYRASQADGHPESQGWTSHTSVDGRGRMVTDQGHRAWQAYGVGGRADWYVVPTAAQHALADQLGWTLSSSLRVMSGHYNTIYYADGGRRYLVILRLDADGNLLATLEGGSTHTLVSGTGGATYHDYVLSYDPNTGLTTFSFDGSLVTSWGGSSTQQNWVMFGNSATAIDGIARYRSVRFEIPGAGVVYSYNADDGSRAPSSQGWSPSLSNNGTGRLVTDQNDWAWQADGTQGRATWVRTPSSLDQLDAASGWRMSARMRILSGDYLTNYYANGSQRGLPIVRLDASGALVARLEGGATHTLLSSLGSSAYHDYEIRYDPTAGQYTFSFDGQDVDTWAGSTTAQNLFVFGNGATGISGVANYRSICFELAP
ncbi:MAG: N,N-dimethylformamidase beta subunit family domain-containing protein [Myxococcota bacterium]